VFALLNCYHFTINVKLAEGSDVMSFKVCNHSIDISGTEVSMEASVTNETEDAGAQHQTNATSAQHNQGIIQNPKCLYHKNF
jgi:hypothetical protein